MAKFKSFVIPMSGLTSREVGGIACDDCGRWAWEDGKPIRHSSRCDTTSLQPAYDWAAIEAARVAAEPMPATEPTPARARQLRAWGRAGEISRADEDEIVDAVAHGVLSMDDAMNRDF